MNPDDLRIETYDDNELHSGNFGFHTPKGIRIKHLPTGITVQCCKHRSPHKNKEEAIALLEIEVDELHGRVCDIFKDHISPIMFIDGDCIKFDGYVSIESMKKIIEIWEGRLKC